MIARNFALVAFVASGCGSSSRVNVGDATGSDGTSVDALPNGSSGGVMWLDPLGYPKPRFVPVAEHPVGANAYWVDLGAGSGTACTMGSPCTWSGAAGKPGIADGTGAYIYIQGNGPIGDLMIAGGVGAEVIVTPWPSCTGDGSPCAIVTGNSAWSSPHQNLIIDGGPNLAIEFDNETANQFSASIALLGTASTVQNVTFARTHFHVGDSGEWIQSYGGWTNLTFINNEFEAAGATDGANQHHLYLSGCNGGQTLEGLTMLANILRDTPGEAIEMRIVNGSTLDKLLIDGNAVHDVGRGTCTSSWNCRSAFTFSLDPSGCAGASGSFGSDLQISDNLLFNLGENCARTWDNPASTRVYNNTCVDWGATASGNGGHYGAAAFANYSYDGANGDFRNNLLFATGSVNGTTKTPYPNNASLGQNQLCAAGTACGTASVAFSTSGASQTVKSTTDSSADFMRIASPTSNAVGAGQNLSAYVKADYLGNPWPPTGAMTIGAMQ